MVELGLMPDDTVKLKSKLYTTLGYVAADNKSVQDDGVVKIGHIMRTNLRVRIGDVIRCDQLINQSINQLQVLRERRPPPNASIIDNPVNPDFGLLTPGSGR